MDRTEEAKQGYELLAEGIEQAQQDGWQKAGKTFEQGLNVGKQCSDRQLQIGALRNLAFVSSKLGDNSQALKYHRQALTVARKEGEADTERVIYNKIGLNYRQLGNLDQALRFHARAIASPIELNPQLSKSVIKTAFSDIGKTLEKMGKMSRAQHFHNQAEAPAFSVLNLWRSMTNLGKLYENSGDTNKANKFYQSAKKSKAQTQESLISLAKDLEKIGESKRANEFQILSEQTQKCDVSLVGVVNQLINKITRDYQRDGKDDKSQEFDSFLSQYQLRVYYVVPRSTRSGFATRFILDDD